MNPTKFSRDTSGHSVGLAHWKWGSRRTLILNDTPVRTSEAFDGHSVFIEATVACHLRLGDTDVVADATDPVLKPGAVYAFPRAQGETHLSVVAKGGLGSGTVEYWQADSFVEA